MKSVHSLGSYYTLRCVCGDYFNDCLTKTETLKKEWGVSLMGCGNPKKEITNTLVTVCVWARTRAANRHEKTRVSRQRMPGSVVVKCRQRTISFVDVVVRKKMNCCAKSRGGGEEWDVQAALRLHWRRLTQLGKVWFYLAYIENKK